MPARILVVEDNALALQLMRDVLRFAGYEVLTATDVKGALEQLEASPALALVDIEIPGGGGVALLQRVRCDARFIGVPLIAVTAHSSPEDHDRLLAVGFDGHAGKPIDVRALPRLVKEWLTLRCS